MFKGRTGILILVGIVSIACVYLLYRGSVLRLPASQKLNLPVDLQNIIPTKWKSTQFNACDFDGDGEAEWLIIFRYDPGDVGRSLLGGVIYDAQADRAPQALGNESPYRPAVLVPYKLLPDFYTGKGQGYLGETGVTVQNYPPAQSGKTCRAGEITIQGFSDATWATRLSIFRWQGLKVGYSGVHFVGNARIAVGNGTTPITDVTTYNRLNDRSALCVVQRYERPKASNAADLPPGIVFTETASAYTIDFCFGAPDDPAYPEGVVVALLRGKSPKGQDDNPSPTGATFLVPSITMPGGLEKLRGKEPQKIRVLSVANDGTVVPNSGTDEQCTAGQVAPSTPPPGTPAAAVWWCGRERATVVTEIVVSDLRRVATWHLLSIANDRINGDAVWRIERVELQ